jgi:hypothetical protein
MSPDSLSDQVDFDMRTSAPSSLTGVRSVAADVVNLFPSNHRELSPLLPPRIVKPEQLFVEIQLCR